LDNRRRREWIAILVACLCLAFVVNLIHFKLTDEYFKATIADVVNARAPAPFQHRLLSPFIVYGLSQLTGLKLVTASYLFSLVVMFALFLLFWKFLRRLFKPTASLVGLFLLALALLAMSAQNVKFTTVCLTCKNYGFRYPYDLTQILFFLGLIFFMLDRKIIAWYALLALATFNRETTLLLLPALFLIWRNDNKRSAAVHLAISFAVWIGIKFLLSNLLPVSGATMDNKIYSNIALFLGQKNGASLLSLLMVFGGFWLFLPFGYRHMPREYRLLLITVPLTFAIMFFVGNLDEIRIFNELAVIAIPSILAGLLGLLEGDSAFLSPAA